DIDESCKANEYLNAEYKKRNRSAAPMTRTAGTTQKEAGDLLLEQGKLTEPQLEQVRKRQRRLNLPQHRAIVDLNFASEEDTWRALAGANNFDFVDPVALNLRPETLELVPIKFILHYHLLPL